MKKAAILLLFVVLAAACAQKGVKIASEPAPVKPFDRPAIDFQYVAVPKLAVFEQPSEGAPVIAKIGLYETVPILARRGDWREVRLFDATGWVRAAELMDGNQAKVLSNDMTPRFFVAPKGVPFRASGEIVFQAKVNTDGDVVDVTVTKNTTGSQPLAEANAQTLREAKFYPMVDKGTWKAFVYEYRVAY